MTLRRTTAALMVAVLLVTVSACDRGSDGTTAAPNDAPTDGVAAARPGITAEVIVNADDSPGEWLSHGRTYSCLLYTSPSPRDED